MSEQPTGGVRRERLADQAYDVIRDRILDRTLGPGARLSVPALAEELGLSRSPIREAVQRLVHDGLCAERPHVGAVVTAPDLDRLADMYRVRGALEGLSAELATQRAEPGLVTDLAALHAAHADAFAAGDHPAVIRADVRFHARLLAGADSLELARSLDPVLARMGLAMMAGEPTTWPRLALAEHAAVLEAVAAGDAPAARAHMEAHIARVRSGLIEKSGTPREVDEP